MNKYIIKLNKYSVKINKYSIKINKYRGQSSTLLCARSYGRCGFG